MYLTCRLSPIAACATILGLILPVCKNVAQTSDAERSPKFEVLSMRAVPNRSVETGRGSFYYGAPTRPCQYLSDRLRCQVSLTDLIIEAYEVKSPQITGPHWMQEVVIAVEGIMPENTSKETARLMLQAALAERMGLKIHRENREMMVYAMVAAKGGLKLQQADIPSQRKLKTIDSQSGSMSAPITMQPGEFFANAITLDDLGYMLRPCYEFGVPVVNLTGAAEAEYKFDMRWPAAEERMGECAFDEGLPGALEREYGIRIEKRKTPMNLLVVDQVNRVPTEN